MTCREAVALAHLSVATGSGDDDDEVSIGWPAVGSGMPRLLPVPSAWWETPAVTTRALSARPEEARTARRFVREILAPCWGLEALADDAEMIVDELVVNAVLHGTQAGLTRANPGTGLTVLRLCMLRRARGSHAGCGRSRQRSAHAQATRLGRGERTRPADRRRAESRVGLEPHRRARQGGLGGATRFLRAALQPRPSGRARPRRSAPPWRSPCCARHTGQSAAQARGPGPS